MAYRSMQYKTRGNASPQGRPRVFFCCAAADFDRLFEPITEELLSVQTNAAIWYLAPGEGTMEGEAFEADLSQMQLLVVPVTTAFLRQDRPDPARTVAFRYAVKHHIPVLPLMQEPGLESIFNELCGDLQFLDKTANDPTAIPYEEKLKRFLEGVLVSDALAKRVREAFDAYIFLSYRKKDRAAAQKIMRLIHENEFCRDIAIWYDEFLTPGENFNNAIAEAMEKSALFALVVTPHLLEDPNYVLTTEYPAARNLKKAILPLEAEQTDAAELARLYEGLRETASTGDAEEVTRRLQALLNETALRQNDDPAHTFLMGIAYLSGVDMEVNHERAVQLITEAAEAGLPEAIQKLVSMYQTGEGVERNYFIAIDWQKKLAACLKKCFEQNATETNLIPFIDAFLDLGFFQRQIDLANEAKETYTEAADFIQTLPTAFRESVKSKISRCYRGLAISYDLLRDRFTAREWLSKAIKLDEELMQQDDSLENKGNLAADYREMGYLFGWTRSAEEVEPFFWFEKAENISRQMVAVSNDPAYLIDIAASYIGIGQTWRRKGKFTDSAEWIRKAIEILEKIVKNDPNSEYHYNLAFAYEQLGHTIGLITEVDRVSVIQTFEKALSHYSFDIKNRGTVDSLRSIAFCAREIVSECSGSEEDKKENYLSIGIKALEELVLQTQSPVFRADLAWLYEDYGVLLKKKKLYKEAKTWFQKSVDQLEVVVRETDTYKAKKKLYRGYCSLRDLFIEQEDFYGALRWNWKVLETLNQIANNLESENVYYTYESQIKSYQKMGEIVEHLDYSAAIKWYEKSVHLCEKAKNEFDLFALDYLHYDVCKKAGDCFRKHNQLKEAEEWYRKSYLICKAAFLKKERLEAQQDLAILCKKNGNVLLEQGLPEQSVAWYQESLENDQELVSKKGTVIARKNLSISFERLGNAYSKLGLLDKALEYYKRYHENAALLASESGDENALYHLGFSCYKLASRNWLDNAERKELLKQLLQIGQQLFQETGRERYQQFIDVAKELLASL